MQSPNHANIGQGPTGELIALIENVTPLGSTSGGHYALAVVGDAARNAEGGHFSSEVHRQLADMYEGIGHSKIDRHGSGLAAAGALARLTVLRHGLVIYGSGPTEAGLPARPEARAELAHIMRKEGVANADGEVASALTLLALYAEQTDDMRLYSQAIGGLAAVGVEQEGVNYAGIRGAVLRREMDEIRGNLITVGVDAWDDRPVFMDAWDEIVRIINGTGNETAARQVMLGYIKKCLPLIKRKELELEAAKQENEEAADETTREPASTNVGSLFGRGDVDRQLQEAARIHTGSAVKDEDTYGEAKDRILSGDGDAALDDFASGKEQGVDSRDNEVDEDTIQLARRALLEAMRNETAPEARAPAADVRTELKDEQTRLLVEMLESTSRRRKAFRWIGKTCLPLLAVAGLAVGDTPQNHTPVPEPRVAIQPAK